MDKALMLNEISYLIYMLDELSKKEGQGTCTDIESNSFSFKWRFGYFKHTGLLEDDNDYGLMHLGSEHDMDFANGEGTVRHGVIVHKGTDTELIFLLQPRSKTVIVSFRGTTSGKDVITDLKAWNVPTCKWAPGGIHEGILAAYDSVREVMMKIAKALLANDTSYNKIMVTGHSLGGGLATLGAYEIARAKLVPKDNLEIYTYGGAIVGDKTFYTQFQTDVPHMWRIVNDRDLIPRLPPKAIARKFGYKHVGKLVLVNQRGGLKINEPAHCACTCNCNTSTGEFVLDHSFLGNGGYTNVLTSVTYMGQLVPDKLSALDKAWRAYTKEGDTLNLMKKLISPPLSLDADKTYLLQAEIRRIQSVLGSELTWHILVVACGNIWLGQDKQAMAYKRHVAEWYIEFEKYDTNKDHHLDSNEFTKLAQDVFGSSICMNTIWEELQKVDCNFHGGVLNFEEYARWRWMCEYTTSKSFESRVPKDKLNAEVNTTETNLSSVSGA